MLEEIEKLLDLAVYKRLKYNAKYGGRNLLVRLVNYKSITQILPLIYFDIDYKE